MKTALPVTVGLVCLVLAWGADAGVEPQRTNTTKADSAKIVARPDGLHGYIGFNATRPPAKSEYSAGMGFYSAVWPLIDRPLAGFQIGLAGAWITPDNSDDKDTPLAPGVRWPGPGRSAGRPGPASSRPWKAVWATGKGITFATGRPSSA